MNNDQADAALAAADTAAAPTAATEVQNVPESQPSASSPGGMGMLVPMLLILAIFYFMMVRPQQRREKERRKMIDELRAGAKIVFAGGLMGTIREATEKTFKVEIAAGTVIEIDRSSVSGVVAAPEPSAR